MKPLYTQIEYDNAKSNDKLSCECYNCGNIFLTLKKSITQQLKNTKSKNKIKFCGLKCSSLSQITKITLNCKNCNSVFEKLSSQYKKTKNHFCSHKCSATFSNLNKTTGYRRSKLEKWIEEKLVLLYPKLEIVFNKKQIIESELDIYIPSLNIAFELNGIFHYKPIYGIKKFNQIQLNDIKKQKKCDEKNITLYTINTSLQKYVNDTTSQIYLNMVTEIIENSYK